jgi:ABC-type transporter Mla MlaB component
MFRISTVDTPQERRLVVEGTLMSPWVAELRRTWGTAGASLEGRKLVIDLTNATMIDSEGEAAILELMQDGAKFRCSGVLTKHVLRQLAQKCNTRLNCVLKPARSKQ